jgi:hypothetical protein
MSESVIEAAVMPSNNMPTRIRIGAAWSVCLLVASFVVSATGTSSIFADPLEVAAEQLVIVGNTIYTSVGPVWSIRPAAAEHGYSGVKYVGNTAYGPATALIVSDACLMITNSTHAINICNGQKTVFAKIAAATSQPASVESNKTSCAFAVYYTQRFKDAMGSQSVLTRYVLSVFEIAASFYKVVSFAGRAGYGIHCQSIDYQSWRLDWSDDVDISVQLDYLNSLAPPGTCDTVVFDALQYSLNRVGVAYVGGACIANSNGMVVSCGANCVNVFTAAQVLAHEAGHTFSAIHTEDYPSNLQCASGIMDATISTSADSFSACSINTMTPFFSSNASCLSAPPLPHTESINIAMIVGIVVGCLLFVCVSVLAVIKCQKKAKSVEG